MDAIVTIHSLVRWLVLLGLVAGAGFGLVGHLRRLPWRDTVYSVATIVLDVQVAIGIVLWIGNQGWDEGFFIAVIHPIFMLAALGILHMTLRKARERGEAGGHAVIGVGMLLALALVIAAIPWAR